MQRFIKEPNVVGVNTHFYFSQCLLFFLKADQTWFGYFFDSLRNRLLPKNEVLITA